MPKRVDGCQRAIVQALRDVAVHVTVASELGHGFPDLVVCFQDLDLNQWITGVMECKQPGEKLTPAEQEWWDNWPGWKAIAHSQDEALAAVGVGGADGG